MGRQGRKYAKASCDFIAGVMVDGEKKLVGVECKARVTAGTMQRECEHRDYLSRFYNTGTNAGGATGSAGTTSCSCRLLP